MDGKRPCFQSSFVIHHVSDVLRILTLWKYTGTYLDLDVIIKKPISTVGSNFACIQNDGLINSAIVNLDSTLGRSIAEKNFDEVIAHFNGNSWTGNGPEVLSNIVKKMCNTTDPNKLHRQNCQGFEVLPSKACYAVHYSDWKQFFEEKYLNEVLESTKDSLAIHFWNYLSGGEKLSTRSNTGYIAIAKEFCPRVLAASGDVF